MRAIIFISLLTIISGLQAQSHRDSLDIIRYNLEVDISEIGSSSITGHTKIIAKPKYPISTIYLDLFALTVDSSFVNGNSVVFNYNDTLITLTNQYFNLNDTILIDIYYHGKPKKDDRWGGFYFTNGIAYNMGVGMTDYPHSIGRYWYPCLDSFTEKAFYDYYIKTSEQNIAVCSGIFVNKTIDTDNKPIYHWELNKPIPTYLSSVAVGPYVKIEDTYIGIHKNIPIEIYATSENVSGVTKTFNKLQQIVSSYENLFGPYPWSRIGYVIVPFGSGAMEHALNIAFPSYALNGSISDETLAAHELAHSWFGNLVTTASSEDMWINEGWASYCEVLFKENVYNKNMALSQVLSNHAMVIETAHLQDNGYYPLNKIPHSETYGTTVYDKGADVVHSLRGYLGDELFFKAVKFYLEQHAFGNVSSYELENTLSEGSGIDLTYFFQNWVYQTGYPHYSIDSFTTNNHKIEFALRQKLNHRTEYGNKHRLPITIMDYNWNTFDTVLQFDGQYGSVSLTSKIEPMAIFTDLHYKLNDATTHDSKVITESGYVMFNDCDFKLNTSFIEDSVLINVIYNYVLPDGFKNEIPGIKISNYHFWKIEALIPAGFFADGKFSYRFSKNTNPQSDYSPSINDTVVLLYRKNAAYDWIVAQKGPSANIPLGDITKVGISSGEYALGFWDGETPIGISQTNANESFEIYPNPVKTQLHIKTLANYSGKIYILDQNGRELSKKHLKNDDSITFALKNYKKGIYFVYIEGYNKIEKFIIQ